KAGIYFALSGLNRKFNSLPGATCSLRSHLPLAIIFRAVGALEEAIGPGRSTWTVVGVALCGHPFQPSEGVATEGHPYNDASKALPLGRVIGCAAGNHVIRMA